MTHLVPSEEPIVVYGAGGHARETAWQAEQSVSPRCVVAFIDDHEDRPLELCSIPVLSLAAAAEAFPGARYIIGVGSPQVREVLAHRAGAAGLRPDTLVHRSVQMSSRVSIEAGTAICAGCIMTTDISIGRHVQVNIACTVSHDVVLEDFVTLSPAVRIAGNVRIERGAFIGIGATIINGRPGAPIVIGAGTVIGAGAVVCQSIAAGVTAVGVPARPLSHGLRISMQQTSPTSSRPS